MRMPQRLQLFNPEMMEKKTHLTRGQACLRAAILTVFLALACLSNAVGNAESDLNLFLYLLSSVPIILSLMLYGYFSGTLIFFLYFLNQCITDFSYAYLSTYTLVGLLCMFFIMHRGWLKEWKSSLKAFIGMSLIQAVAFLICYGLIANATYEVTKVLTYGLALLATLPSAFITCGIGYLLYCGKWTGWMRFIPDCWSNLHEENEWRIDRVKSLRGRITVMLCVVVGAISIFAAIFANYLMPDLADMMVIQEESTDTASEEEETETDSDYVSRAGFWSNMDFASNFKLQSEEDEQVYNFQFNDYSMTFDLKLILMIINLAVPILVIANAYAQKRIAEPILAMTATLGEFQNADTQESQNECIQKVEDLQIDTRDEIQILYHSILDNLHQNADFVEKLKQEQLLEEELRVARATSDAKSNFLSNMSHEIRTPINAVLGMDEMILRECEDPDILEYAANIQNSGKTLLSLVNDILDFSKIEAGKMEIIPVEYELSSVINDLINMIRVKAENKGLELNINVNPQTPHMLFGDEIRIKQCVTNVLSNAVKYTEKGSITLYVNYREAEDDSILLSFRVKDTGIGIKEEDLAKLFSPFERIEEKRNRTIEGTGLGMNIVRQLLSLMDSELQVSSVYGEGSDFSFEILQKVVSREPIGDFQETYRNSLMQQEKYQESFHAPDARILVVDDTPINLTVVKGLLKATGIQVDTAESGAETLQKVQKTAYDVIFLDHMMPKMDGLQTRAALETLEGNLSAGAPCIALTANAVSGVREEYLKAGFDDYLSKPIDSAKLEKMLLQYLPAEKVITPDSEGWETVTIHEDTPSNGQDADNPLRKLEGIDYDAALANCMNEEILVSAMHDFYRALKTQPDRIADFADAENWREYTILVHALKSSARLIGALELSAMAAELEACGNREDAGTIREKTPAMLELYRSYEEKLAPLCRQEDQEDESLPLIDPGELSQAYEALADLVEAFDFDSADDMLQLLENYRIPDSEKARYNEIRDAIAGVDRDTVLKLLGRE